MQGKGWRNNMALDATRGLPSFSEMLSAFRNRGSLADGLKAGLAGYEKGVGMAAAEKKAASDQRLQGAQTEEALAKAESLRSGGTKKRIPLAALPEAAKTALAAYADEAGTVAEEAAKIYLSTTEQGGKNDRANEMLKLQQERLAAEQKAAEERAALQAELTRVREESGVASRELNAAKTVAETTSRAEAPTMLESGIISPVKEFITGDPLSSVLAQRQNKAAMEKLSQTGGISPQPAPRPALAPSKPKIQPKNPVRQKAIDELTAAGAPITEANIQEAIRQLGQQ